MLTIFITLYLLFGAASAVTSYFVLPERQRCGKERAVIACIYWTLFWPCEAVVCLREEYEDRLPWI